jgi:hypothetical protein
MKRLNTKDPAVQFLLAELEELERQKRDLLIQCQRIRKKLDAMRLPLPLTDRQPPLSQRIRKKLDAMRRRGT